MTTLSDIRNTLASRNLDELVGREEDFWFDAKGAAGYDLSSPDGRWQLAKDVSSFANADGGYIIVGLETQRRLDSRLEVVSNLELIDESAFNTSQVLGVLRDYLFPPIRQLEIMWVHAANDAARGVGVIHIPSLPPDQRFVLMARTMEEGAVIKSIVFGLAIRNGESSVPSTLDQLFRICQDGRTTSAQRLMRIEGKIDHLITLMEQQREAPQEDSYSQDMEARLRNIIGDIER